MLSGHRSCGVQMWREAVYVFGSHVTEGEKKSECLQLRDLVWTALPDMHAPRSCFTPAVWRNAIYLCGGTGNDTVEVWDCHSMTLWSLKLPALNITLSCATDNQLLMLSSDYLIFLTESTAAHPTMVTKRHSQGWIRSNPSPVLYKDVIYRFGANGKVRKLSLITDIF